MGKGSAPVIGYRYIMTMQMGLCGGPVDALLKIVGGGKTMLSDAITASTSMAIDKPNLYGGDKSEGGVQGQLDVMMGEATQTPNAQLVAELGAPMPAFRGLFTLVFRGMVGAMNPYVKAWAFQVQRFIKGWRTDVWQSSLCQVGSGMNGAHFIYRAITDPVTGLGRDPSALDLDRMLVAAQTMFDEGLGLCLKWSRSDVLANFVQIVNDHCGAMFVDDPATGKQYMKLLRGDYDIDTVPLIDESNVLDLGQVEQSLLAESINEVTVTYHDCDTNLDAAVTVQNTANIAIQGRVVTQSTSYPGIWSHDLAVRTAMRDLKAVSSLPWRVSSLKVQSSDTLRDLRKGDVVAFSWSDLNFVKMPLRILEIDRGTPTSNAITLTCAQDVYSLPDQTYIVVQPPLWVAPDLDPHPVPEQLLLEASYRDLAAQMRAADLAVLDATSGFVGALGARPTSAAYGYDLYTRIGGSGAFKQVGAGSFTPTGLLASAMPLQNDSTVITLTNAVDLDQVQTATEALIDDELCRVDAVDAVNSIVTLARGCVDTVPALHAAGARVWFTDGYTGADPTEYATGETINAQLLVRAGNGVLDPSDAVTASVLLDERQARPYPPAGYTVNGNPWYAPGGPIVGTCTFAWKHRDRVTQADQLIDAAHTDIGPEAGTTYTLKIYVDGVLDTTTTGITGNSAAPVISTGGTVHAILDAQRDGLDSWQNIQTADFDYETGGIAINGDAPDGVNGVAYSYDYLITGGLPPYSLIGSGVSAGAVPTGLSLAVVGNKLRLSGTPSATSAFTWTNDVQDSLSAAATLADGAHIYSTLTLSGTYAAGVTGVAYSSDLAIAGGDGTYSNPRITAGTLPTGLTLSIVSGNLRLSGTPSVAAGFSFTAAVDSGDGQTGASGQSVAIGSAQTTWSATNKSSDISLSVGNTVASTSSASAGGTVLSNTVKTAGKFYVEIQCVSSGGTDGAMAAGLHVGTSTLTDYLGQDANGWGSWAEGAGRTTRDTTHNATTTNSTTGSGSTIGQYVRIAVDIDAGKLWLSYFGVTSGWIGGGDPAAGTTPTYTFTAGSSTYFACSPRASVNQLALVDPGSWGSAAPSGFGVWT